MTDAARLEANRSHDGVPAPARILIWDDDSDFAYLEDLDVPQITFIPCQSFEELDHYLYSAKNDPKELPDIVALDVWCDKYKDFSLLGLPVALDENRCGVQIYEHILRPTHETFETVPTIFFTSYEKAAQSIAGDHLTDRFGSQISSCTRGELQRKLLDLVVQGGWVAEEDANKIIGLSQDDYLSLFKGLAAELELTEDEQRNFFGLLSERKGEVGDILALTTIANERIDLLLAISVLLDALLGDADKRTYILNEFHPGMSMLDAVLTGSTHDLLRLKVELEYRAGGPIL